MSHPKNKDIPQEVIDRNPFIQMKIDDTQILNQINSRSICSRCLKSRKYYCYSCYIPISDLEGKIPQVELPFQIDIIKHKLEIDGKSTAAHAAILASNYVTVYEYPDIPNYTPSDDLVLIYPSRNAQTIDELINQACERQENCLEKGHNPSTLLKSKINYLKTNSKRISTIPIKKAIFIDSTWNQSKGIYKDTRLNQLKCIVLQNRASQFWRHQKNSPRWYLATIEAIHQLCVEFHIKAYGCDKNYLALKYMFCDFDAIQQFLNGGDGLMTYNGQYDNLLFFFKYMHEKINTIYNHCELKAYKRPL